MKTTRPRAPAEEKLSAAGNQRQALTSVSQGSGPLERKKFVSHPRQ